MSKNFEKFKEHYDNGLLTKEQLRNLIDKKLGITRQEFEQITRKVVKE